MTRIVLRINKLVLKGFRQEDRQAISAGLQQELSRLLTDPRTVQGLTRPGDSTRLQTGSIHIAQGSKPLRVGVQVAQGIGKEFKK